MWNIWQHSSYLKVATWFQNLDSCLLCVRLVPARHCLVHSILTLCWWWYLLLVSRILILSNTFIHSYYWGSMYIPFILVICLFYVWLVPGGHFLISTMLKWFIMMMSIISSLILIITLASFILMVGDIIVSMIFIISLLCVRLVPGRHFLMSTTLKVFTMMLSILSSIPNVTLVSFIRVVGDMLFSFILIMCLPCIRLVPERHIVYHIESIYQDAMYSELYSYHHISFVYSCCWFYISFIYSDHAFILRPACTQKVQVLSKKYIYIYIYIYENGTCEKIYSQLPSWHW